MRDPSLFPFDPASMADELLDTGKIFFPLILISAIVTLRVAVRVSSVSSRTARET